MKCRDRYSENWHEIASKIKKEAKWRCQNCGLIRYLNNLIEQDHRFLKRRIKPGLGFGLFNTARRTIHGYEVMNMTRKGQVKNVGKDDVMGQI